MTQRRRFRGTPLVGRVVDPVGINLRLLAMQLVAQAVRDAHSGRSWVQRDAVAWLNSAEGRGLASAFGLTWARTERPITAGDLPQRVRNTYFRGD